MALNAPYEALIGIITTTIVTSGIPESILGGLVAYGVAKVYIREILTWWINYENSFRNRCRGIYNENSWI